MAENLTIIELQAARAITASEVESAVSAILSNPNVRDHAIGCYVLDLAAALAASRVTTMILRDPHANDRHKRTAARSAILMARPLTP